MMSKNCYVIFLLFFPLLSIANESEKELLENKIKGYQLMMLKKTFSYAADQNNITYDEEQLNKIETIEGVANEVERIFVNCEDCENIRSNFNILIYEEKSINYFGSIEDTDSKRTLTGWQIQHIPSLFPNEILKNELLLRILNLAKNDLVISFLQAEEKKSIRIPIVLTYYRKIINSDEKKNKLNRLSKDLKSLEGSVESNSIRITLNKISSIVNLELQETPISWLKLIKAIENWDETESAALRNSPPRFPIHSNECLKEYADFIQKVRIDTSNICYFHLNDSEKQTLDKLINIYDKYEMNGVDSTKQFLDEFESNSGKFKGHLNAKNFILKGDKNWIDDILKFIGVLIAFLLGYLIWIVVRNRLGKNIEHVDNNGEAPLKGNTLTINEAMAQQKDKGEKEDLNVLIEKEKKLNQREKELNRRERAIEKENTVFRKNQKTQNPDKQINSPNVVWELNQKDIKESSRAQVKYALRVDGNQGFLITSLSDDETGNYYFELFCDDTDKGKFRVRKNKELEMSAARSANTILADACKYVNMPFEINKGIITEEEGEIEKSGDQWKITKKARIRFV